jgi:hypothetical protein
MTIPLTKLIAENKERPIAEASRKTNSRFLLKIDTCWVVGFWNGFSWEGEDDGLLLYPTHFRPLPDDRLAFVAEHYRAGVDAFISMFEPLAEKSGIYGAALEFAQGLQKQAEAIAEGKDKTDEAHNG